MPKLLCHVNLYRMHRLQIDPRQTGRAKFVPLSAIKSLLKALPVGSKACVGCLTRNNPGGRCVNAAEILHSYFSV